MEVLLGTLFRKFCESCEKYEGEQIPMRARDLRTQVQRTIDSLTDGLGYRLRRLVLEPVANHVSYLIEEGTRAGEERMMPSVRITGEVFKLDLADAAGVVVFPARVMNAGDGTAHAIGIGPGEGAKGIDLSLSEPAGPVRPSTWYGAAGPPPAWRFPLRAEPRAADDRGVRDGEREAGEFRADPGVPAAADAAGLGRAGAQASIRDQPDPGTKGPVRAGFDPVRSGTPRLERDVDFFSGVRSGWVRRPYCRFWRRT